MRKRKLFGVRSTDPPFPSDHNVRLGIIELEENNLGKEKKTRSTPSVVD